MGNRETKDRITPSHRDFLIKLEESNPEFFKNQKTNKLKFFWLSNRNPDKEEYSPNWSPYEEEDNLYIEYCYQEYEKGKQIYPRVGDYLIDFDKGIQFHFKDNWRERRIIRVDPANVNFVYRKSRFTTNLFLTENKDPDIEKISHDKMDNIETKNIGELEIKINKKDISSHINNKYITMNFNILPGKEIKFLLLKTFYEKMTISLKEMDLKSLINKLSIELDLYADSLNRYNIYKHKYILDMDENNFCTNILRMYSVEGFLFRVVNKVLREKDLSEFKKIQHYYLCLLAAFEYSSSIANEKIVTNPKIPDEVKTNIKLFKKFHLYRGIKIFEKEIKYLKKNSPFIRIYNEFLSCSLVRDEALRFARNCIIELEVEFKNLNENNYFTFLNDELTEFETEREILLKSGAIIHVKSFEKNSDENGPQYIIKGKVISFDEKELFTCIIKGFNEKKLDLSENSLGLNYENVKYLSESLKENNTISDLNLFYNLLGKDSENIKSLSEALKQNETITKLDLSGNSIGSNLENINFLSEALKVNKSITELNLSSNLLGSNPDDMKHLSESLIQNKTITDLYLSGNSIGFDPENMKYLSQALKKNMTITDLYINCNSLGSHGANMEYLSNALKENKTIRKLDLSGNLLGNLTENIKQFSDSLKENKTITVLSFKWNSIGSNLENMEYFSEALQKNNTITNLDLFNNSLGSNPENIKHFSKLLNANKTISKLDLSSNLLGSNQENMIYLSEALKESNTILELNLSSNLLGSNPENMIYLSEALKNNKTITELNLRGNSLGSNPDDMKYLSISLKENKSIIKLNLSENLFGSNLDDMEYLSEALKENVTIAELNLRFNSIKQELLDKLRLIRNNLKINF